MLLSYIDITGFRSIINRTKIVLNSPGVNIVQGLNGSGKTQIWNALSWALYFKLLNEANNPETWKELRPDKYTGIRVEVGLKKGKDKYTIIKCKNFKGFDGKDKKYTGTEILLNGEPLKNLRDSKDYQKKIAEILGISFRLFKNSVMFGQKLKRLIEESGGEQKELFNEAFEVEFLKLARKKVEDRRIWLTSDLGPLEKKRDQYDNRYKRFKAIYLTDRQNRRAFEKNREDRVAIIALKVINIMEDIKALELGKPKNIKGIQKEFEYLKDKLSKEDDINDRYINHSNLRNKERGKRDKLKEEKIRLDNEIIDLKKNATDICYACGNKLNPKQIKDQTNKLEIEVDKRLKRINAIEGDISEHKKAINRLTKLIDSISNEISQRKSDLEKKKILEGKINDYQRLTELIADKEDYLKTLKEQQEVVEDEKYKGINRIKTRNKIKRYSNRVEIYGEKIAPIKKELDTIEWMLHEPLSNKGLNSYIFNSMLTSLNDRLSYYSSLLGFKIHFGIKINSARKDFYANITQKGITKPYEDLSGGQAQLVNIAIAFAVHDIINESKGFSLLILDEAFESLDGTNIEKVSGLIELKARNKSLWLITHLKDFEITNAKYLNVTWDDQQGTIIE